MGMPPEYFDYCPRHQCYFGTTSSCAACTIEQRLKEATSGRVPIVYNFPSDLYSRLQSLSLANVRYEHAHYGSMFYPTYGPISASLEFVAQVKPPDFVEPKTNHAFLMTHDQLFPWGPPENIKRWTTNHVLSAALTSKAMLLLRIQQRIVDYPNLHLDSVEWGDRSVTIWVDGTGPADLFRAALQYNDVPINLQVEVRRTDEQLEAVLPPTLPELV